MSTSSVSPASTPVSSVSSTSPTPDLYLVIHISTTADDQGIYITRDNSEIIEIAWSVLESGSLAEVCKDSVFVKPLNTPITPLCTAATSLTWDQVKNAGSLKEAIEQLDKTVQDKIVSENKSFAFVTFQSWDLRMKLTKEARERSIMLPPYLELSRHFDLRREYMKLEEALHPEQLMGSYSAKLNQLTLNSVCTSLEIDVAQIEPVSGTKPFNLSMPKRAADEVALMQLILKDIVKKAPAQSQILTKPHDMHLDLTQFLNEKSKVLYMTNLPLDTTQSELESWFTQFGGRPIAFWTIKAADRSGASSPVKPTSSGFAVFATHDEAIDSLAMNGRVLNDKIIEVQPSSVIVLDKAQDILTPFPSSKNRPRPGDWTCPSCGFSNFQRRTACFRCSFPAASAAAIQESMYTGPSNSSSNSQFNLPYQIGSQQPQQNQSLPNLANMYQSRASQSQQPQQQPQQQTQPQQQQNGSSNVPFRAGDWKCINENCAYHNFAKNMSCLKCGAPRVSSGNTLHQPQPNHDYYHHHQPGYQRANSAQGQQNGSRPGYYQHMLNNGSMYQQQSHGSTGHLHYTNTNNSYHTPPPMQQQQQQYGEVMSPAVEDLKHLASRLGGLNLNTLT